MLHPRCRFWGPPAVTGRVLPPSVPPPPQPHPAWPLTHAGWDGRASSANIFRNEIAGAVFTLFIFLTLFISYLSIGGWGTVSTGTGLSASPVPC